MKTAIVYDSITGNTALLARALQQEVPEGVAAHYKELSKNASDCIGCKDCEDRCPFHVTVAERMEKTRRLFEKSNCSSRK